MTDIRPEPPRVVPPPASVVVPRDVPAGPVQHPSAITLFLAFLRLGLTAFGGPAMVAYIRTLAVTRKRWLDDRCFADGVALCQSLPGATSMQTAAYVGLRVAGVRGALAAYVGFGLPAWVLMTALSAIYAQTRDVRWVDSIFHGLQAIVVALVAHATLTFGRNSIKGWRDVVLVAGAAVFLLLRGSPVLLIVAAAGLGVLLFRRTDGARTTPSCPGSTGASPRILSALALCLVVGAGLTGLWALDRRLAELAVLMLKVDAFAFGGGFASVPLMLHEVVRARHWMDSHTFMDGIVLGQVTPGPIVITATFVGYQVDGLLGAVVGTIAIFTPSFIVLVATVPYFDRLQASPLFRRAVRGAMLSFVGLLLSTTVHFGTAVSWNVATIALAAFAFVALHWRMLVRLRRSSSAASRGRPS